MNIENLSEIAEILNVKVRDLFDYSELQQGKSN